VLQKYIQPLESVTGNQPFFIHQQTKKSKSADLFMPAPLYISTPKPVQTEKNKH